MESLNWFYRMQWILPSKLLKDQIKEAAKNLDGPHRLNAERLYDLFRGCIKFFDSLKRSSISYELLNLDLGDRLIKRWSKLTPPLRKFVEERCSVVDKLYETEEPCVPETDSKESKQITKFDPSLFEKKSASILGHKIFCVQMFSCVWFKYEKL